MALPAAVSNRGGGTSASGSSVLGKGGLPFIRDRRLFLFQDCPAPRLLLKVQHTDTDSVRISNGPKMPASTANDKRRHAPGE